MSDFMFDLLVLLVASFFVMSGVGAVVDISKAVRGFLKGRRRG